MVFGTGNELHTSQNYSRGELSPRLSEPHFTPNVMKRYLTLVPECLQNDWSEIAFPSFVLRFL